MAADSKSPLDHALDLVVFAPFGLALTVKDELPALVEKGRQRLGSQVVVAKMVGQFAAAQGQRAAGRLIDQMTSAAGRIGGLPPTAPDGAGRAGTGASAPSSGNGAVSNGNGHQPAADGDATVRAAVGGDTGDGPPRPSADTLAIPGYDSLAAAQVVQRLAGLSAPELEAVRRYELATRGRRTILSKIAQLEADRSSGDAAPRR